MSGPRLAYVANVRLPTEKAHGVQIARMCDALASHETDLTLFHPRRRQDDRALAAMSLADYYGIRAVFQVRTLPNVDVVPLSRVVPPRLFVPIFFAHALAWGLLAARLAGRSGADLFITRDVPVAYWLVRMGLPTVYEAHGVPRRAQRRLLGALASLPALRLTVALTSYIGRSLEELGVPAAKIRVLPDGVDLDAYADLPDRDACRRRLGLSPGRPIVGYVGRFQAFEAERGLPELVAAVAAVPDGPEGPPLLLCVGGPMHAVPAYVAVARAAGMAPERLLFLDHVPAAEVPYWIRACDVVTIPSPATEHYAYYSSPLKLFEYMAAGVPIVASDLPALRDILRDDANALLAAPGNPSMLGALLHALLDDRSRGRRLARQARLDVEAFTWRRRAGTLLAASGFLPSSETA